VADTIANSGRLHLAQQQRPMLGDIGPLATYPLALARKMFEVNVLGLLHLSAAPDPAHGGAGGGHRQHRVRLGRSRRASDRRLYGDQARSESG